MTTFANSGNVQPVQGGEVACASIAGGPFAAVDGYVRGGTPGVQLEFRLYATVGALRTRVAVAPYAGPPVGAAGQGTLLKWTVIGQPQATSPVVAGGTTYDLVVFAINGAGSGILATLAGTSAYDANVNASGTAALPSNYGSTSILTNVGCAQLADVGVDQVGLPSNVVFDVFASCGAGSVEALVGSGGSGGSDGKSDVLRALPLPVATQYRLAVREIQGQQLVGNVTASLATYAAIVASSSAGGGGKYAVTSTTDADVHVGGTGLIYEGLNGLTAIRTVFLNPAAGIGDATKVKDEDGSLMNFDIIIDPGAGNTIDGNATYTMTAALNTPQGAVELIKISATKWAVT